MEIVCDGEISQTLDPVNTCQWMQGKPITQCKSKTENTVIGTITLAEPVGDHRIRVYVTITDPDVCKEFQRLNYSTYSIRNCKVV